LGLDNVTVIAADGALGAPEFAPFDRIIVTAAAPEIQPAWQEQLKEGGILVVPIGPAGGVQTLTKLTKRGNEWSHEALMAVRFVPLVAGKPRRRNCRPKGFPMQSGRASQAHSASRSCRQRFGPRLRWRQSPHPSEPTKIDPWPHSVK
jgi:hypothetical protein